MLNYIASELYRITHTRPAYVTCASLCAGILAINLALHFLGNGPQWYGHTSFSYALNISEPFLYVIMGALVAFVLYESRRKNGNLKNSVAFGLTRPQLFVGQCLTALLTATAIMVVVLAVWIASAEGLLARTEIWTLSDFLASTAYVYLLAIAGLVSTVFFIAIFQREMTAVVACIAVWNFFPTICRILGAKFEIFAHIASWLPSNFFAADSIIRWWEEPDILEKATVSGVVGLLVFGLLGVVSLRKRDL